MSPLLLSLGLFAAWWTFGLAVLAAVRADTRDLRIVLTAPLLGTAAAIIPLFTLSYLSVAMTTAALPVAVVLVVLAVAALAIRRPSVPRNAAPVIGAAVLALVLIGRPFLTYGFSWISDANDDMANYILSATYLIHHGLLAPVDLAGLSHDRNYVSVSASLHHVGSRPGADILLAAVSALVGRPPVQMFMPLILSLALCAVCGTGALAMQASRRWWAATVAALLLAVSPQMSFGVLVQLMPQTWGLGLAAALCALLMREELHRPPGAGVREVVLITLLAIAAVVVYVELASTLALAYLLYIAVLALRRRLDLRVSARLWVPAVLLMALVLNSYGLREVKYVRSQASVGVHSVYTGPPNWGYTLVPSALPGIIGIQALPSTSDGASVRWSIIAAVVLLLLVGVGAVWGAIRGVATCVLLVSYLLIGVYLGANRGDFGLFKLFMYVQPFIACAVAVWFAAVRDRRLLAILGAGLAVWLVLQISTQGVYLKESRNPLALRDASNRTLLGTFDHVLATDPKPIVSVTENYVLGKLEAATMGNRPLYFISQNLFDQRASVEAQRNGWHLRNFALHSAARPHLDPFWENTHTSRILAAGNCTLLLPSGRQIVINRRVFPENTEDIIASACPGPQNVLVFVASKLGWGFYGFAARRDVSLYPPESDFFDPGHTMAGFGRYVLFRVLHPTRTVRLELDLTTTYLHTPLPPAAVVGRRRVPLPLVGVGSARVFSDPLQVQYVDGKPYVLLDMGRNGALLTTKRNGIQNLYGGSVPLDPRFLTSFVKDVSLLDERGYARLRVPRRLSSFPAALNNPDLSYSGFYEDGWVGKSSYAVLRGGSATHLTVRGVVIVPHGQGLRVLVNGRLVATRHVVPGPLDLRVPLAASSGSRKIELVWSSRSRLPPPDGRSVSALIQHLGV